jgi:nitrite reductase (NADH) small subunit
MSTGHWIRIGRPEDIPPREGRAVDVAGTEIAVFNLGGRFVALTNRCPHRGGPLADGILTATSVVCPLHGWKVDLQQGCVERPAGEPACVETYPVRVEQDTIAVRVPVGMAAAGGEAA